MDVQKLAFTGESMQDKAKQKYVHERLLPLLKDLGFCHIRVALETDVADWDLVFYDVDRFGVQRLYGAGVFAGDLANESTSEIVESVERAHGALDAPFDGNPLQKHFLSGYYIIISGRLGNAARAAILEISGGKSVIPLDAAEIERLETQGKPRTCELERLRIGAMAAIRSIPEDTAAFEECLNEINMLEGRREEDKIQVLDGVALEVPCISDDGTRLLVEYILWHITGWDAPAFVESMYGLNRAHRMLHQILSSLSGIGFAAIAYGRKQRTVQTVLDAVVDVADKARLIVSEETYHACRSLLVSMADKARSEKREGVAALIKDTASKLR